MKLFLTVALLLLGEAAVFVSLLILLEWLFPTYPRPRKPQHVWRMFPPLSPPYVFGFGYDPYNTLDVHHIYHRVLTKSDIS